MMLSVCIAVEFFSGSGVWSRCVRKSGLFDVVIEVDIRYGEHHDLSNRGVVLKWVSFLR